MVQQAQIIKEELIEMRRWLHAHAETGFGTENTRAYVFSKLQEMGYAPRFCGKGGVLADMTGKPGKTILLRADMDALPIREETGLGYACNTGSMHACGHDMHTAMLLGAAKLLKQYEGKLAGNVRFLFQSAEEIFEGAKDVIEDGALEGVDAAIMIHVTVGTPLPTGTAIISSPGVSAPAADYFTIRVLGKGCHGSTPQDGVDPMIPAAQILLALQQIQTRELGINDKAVLTVGTIQGGTAPNAIAESVELRGTLRTLDEGVRQKIKTRMADISRGIAAAFRAEAGVVFGSGTPCLENDAAMSKLAAASLKQLLGSNRAFTTRELNPNGGPSAGGSEDFAYISQQVPAVMVALSVGTPEQGHRHPLHHPKVTFDEDALPIGAAIHAFTALQYLEHG